VNEVIAPAPSEATLPPPSLAELQRSTWGMWAFLASDAMTFAALLTSAALLRAQSRDWPSATTVFNLGTAIAMTILLLVSSGFMVTALSGIKQNNHKQFRTFLLFTLLCGTAFVILQGLEWHELIRQGMTMTQNSWGVGLFGATFYVLTGFHGLHVLGGVIYLAAILLRGWRGHYHSEHYAAVEIAGLYWHFVDIVWIFVFIFVYVF
jgi:heme/copper-type cytochrome/quinol oxidase subunit 3